MGRPGASHTGVWIDRALVCLAAAYFIAIAAWNFGSSIYSSADDVANGRLWLLLTSALDVQGAAPAAQLALTAAVAAFVIAREGPRLWWVAALGAHVVSALFAYGVIGLAAALGSEGAERVANDPDYGVSCVLAGSVGAMFASGLVALIGARRAAQPVWHPHSLARGPRGNWIAIVLGAAGFFALLTVTFGWYDMEHVIAFAFGALVVWLARGRRRPSKAAQPEALRSV